MGFTNSSVLKFYAELMLPALFQLPAQLFRGSFRCRFIADPAPVFAPQQLLRIGCTFAAVGTFSASHTTVESGSSRGLWRRGSVCQRV